MNLSSLSATASVKATAIPLDRLADNSQLTESAKLAEAARQFEAVLLRQILAAARKSVIPSNLMPPSSVTDIYDDMVNAQMADSVSRSGSFGLARALEHQLSRQAGSGAPAAAEPESTVPRNPGSATPFGFLP